MDYALRLLAARLFVTICMLAASYRAHPNYSKAKILGNLQAIKR